MTSEQEIIYLDNAATTFPKPEAVYLAMDSFYRQFGGNAGRGANPLARKAAGLVDETRAMLRAWLSAPEVTFAPSATIALNTVIMGAKLRAGDVVYVTPFEHNSVLRPLEHLRKTFGIQIRVLPFDKHSFECRLDEVKKLFRLEPPAMLCLSQVSNVLGLVIPVDELAQIAKQIRPDSITLVDGAQAAGLRQLEMSLIDALVWSGHKSLYGPYGIAGIAFGTQWRPEPLLRGGTGTISESIEMPEEGVSRFEAGSQNISAIAGLNASLKWLNETGRDTIIEHSRSLTNLLSDVLSNLSDVIVYLPGDRNLITGIVSFSVNNIKPQMIETALGAQNIAVRAGLHCSPWTHEFINSTASGGTVRVSVGYFNTDKDIQQLRSIIESIIYV
ncbi:aminotransferase class V-fold PLP-dependent enzyme [Phototrophicus methaneseepsis]|uniref:Aminotransferase class V-fold PLP-dependent enzyme n=1 Tax=Phototrophicus methaneseepsis TaxID=2710758 RepID=A0A7S8E9T4_9CHLR|nr:aminotransferase class V-fold PLP-dependent enzyme [Phototrophicus methaneseepsis]QPC83016.1 aminotransferase class V-fold PLP-dependent enzyme [Phototrophicus methaneseepsis]